MGCPTHRFRRWPPTGCRSKHRGDSRRSFAGRWGQRGLQIHRQRHRGEAHRNARWPTTGHSRPQTNLLRLQIHIAHLALQAIRLPCCIPFHEAKWGRRPPVHAIGGELAPLLLHAGRPLDPRASRHLMPQGIGLRPVLNTTNSPDQGDEIRHIDRTQRIQSGLLCPRRRISQEWSGDRCRPHHRM